MSRILLVIDVQKQFKDNKGTYEKIEDFCKEYRAEYDIILPTVFQNNEDCNPNYIKHLRWRGCTEAAVIDSAIYPKNVFNLDLACVEVKHGYASDYIFKIADKYDIDIVGCDSDACVLATAFKLWDSGYNFRILTEYVYTTAEDFNNETVIKIMRRNFGDCVI